MKIKYIVYVIIIAFIGGIIAKQYETPSKDIQKGIADKIIRLHCIANSNSKKDQSIKLLVRDAVLKYIEPLLSECGGIDEGRQIISENILQIEEVAQNTLQQISKDKTVKASLGRSFFPTKMYGDLIFPAGEYEALKIEIGNAKGANWWCIVFPNLCFIDITYKLIPEESKKKLQSVLTEEEYQGILHNKEKLKIKFKIVEYFTD